MTNEMLEKLQAFMESEEGKKTMDAWFEKEAKRQEIRDYQKLRIKKFWHDQASFDAFMTRVISMNDSAWEEKCYERGVMPYPTRILSIVHDIADCEGVDHEGIDEFTTEWPCDMCSYMGWQFAVTHGQGSVLSVYHNRELMLRL